MSKNNKQTTSLETFQLRVEAAAVKAREGFPKICSDKCRYLEDILPINDPTSPSILDRVGEKNMLLILDSFYYPGAGTYCDCVEDHLNAVVEYHVNDATY